MKNFSMSMLCAMVSFLSMAVIAQAGTTAPDVIEMETQAYEKHTKPIVPFSHKKHATEYASEYPELFKDGCGRCHHDHHGKPLAQLKPGEEVHGCILCHRKPGMPKKKKDGSPLSKKARLSSHGYSIHKNCKGCHKDFNEMNESAVAPIACDQCHPEHDK